EKTIEMMAWENWGLSPMQFKRPGNQGLDLFFYGAGENRGLWAFGEAKPKAGLGALSWLESGKTIGGIRQGSRYYIGMNLQTYIYQGGTEAQMANYLTNQLRLGNVKSFVGSSSGKLWELNYAMGANFQLEPAAAKLVLVL